MTTYFETTKRLELFLEGIRAAAYAEPESPLHTQVTQEVWDRVRPKMELPIAGTVLDVGCGSGVAMKLFREYALKVTGITCVREEFEAVEKRFPGAVQFLDMHDIGIYEGYADLIWCRHCLEHSPMPAFWLQQAHRAIKEEGWLYVEVPAPNTACRHETNPSHHFVAGKAMWESLFFRSNFAVADSFEVNFTTSLGPDIYYCWLLKRR